MLDLDLLQAVSIPTIQFLDKFHIPGDSRLEHAEPELFQYFSDQNASPFLAFGFGLQGLEQFLQRSKIGTPLLVEETFEGCI